ncbi:MAG: PilW family protein, partial [Prochlorococcus sp.]
MKILSFKKSLHNKPRLPELHRPSLRDCQQSSGFSMTEALVAVAAGVLIIGAGALALRSTQSLIKGSGEKTTQRQNITNGLRLMRSEIERSQFVLVSGTTEGSPQNTNLDDIAQDDDGIIKTCKGLATSQGSEFLPVFGLKMPEEEAIPPVLYGISEASADSSQYAIKRCGTPLNTVGEYDQLKADGTDNPPFIATIISGVGMMPKQQCEEEGWESINECTQYTKGDDHEIKHTALEVLQSLNGNSPFTITDNKTPERLYMQPALRIKTDINRKFLKIISPNCPDQNNDQSNCEEYSFTEISKGSRSLSKQPLLLTAFARADKRLGNNIDRPVDPTSNNQNDDGNQNDG